MVCMRLREILTCKNILVIRDEKKILSFKMRKIRPKILTTNLFTKKFCTFFLILNFKLLKSPLTVKEI